MNWQTVEHWQADSGHAVWELYLRELDDVFAKAWRVEWGQYGHGRRSASFTGDDREQLARAELERRKAGYDGAEWKLVG
jgi:hypothetical protein